jgi:phosphatidylglycerol:prolipoprotein diacylglycerol transferase
LPQGVYPTSVYEAIIMAVLFAIFWAIRKRVKVWGWMFSLYLIVNGIERFSIETIRVNHRYEAFFNLSQAQLVAIGFVVTGLTTAFIFYKQHEKRKKRI